MKRALIVGLAAMAAMSQAWASDEKGKKVEGPTGLDTKEATIPFLNQNSIESWEADGTTGLWIQDQRKQWYYAKLFAPCEGLEFTVRLGFRNRTLNQLSRDSEAVMPNGNRCQFQSLRKSDPPPGDGKRRHKHEPEAEAPAAAK
jgi:hypothetical protein